MENLQKMPPSPVHSPAELRPARRRRAEKRLMKVVCWKG